MMYVDDLIRFIASLGSARHGSEEIDWQLLRMAQRQPRFQMRQVVMPPRPPHADFDPAQSAVQAIREFSVEQWFSRHFETSLNLIPDGFTITYMAQHERGGPWAVTISRLATPVDRIGEEITSVAATPALAVCRAVAELVLKRHFECARGGIPRDPFLHLRKF